MLLYLSLLLLSNLLENFVPVGSSGVGPCLQAGDQVPLRLKIKGKLLKELRPIFSQTFPWSKCQWWDWNPRSEDYEWAVDHCAGALTLIIMELSIVTFSRTTFSIVTFSKVTFSIVTFSIATFRIVTFSIATFSIVTSGIVTSGIVTFSIATFSTVTFSIATFSIETFRVRALSIKG
jgi:hypothetical protein